MSGRREVVGRSEIGRFGGREAGHNRGLGGVGPYGRRAIAGSSSAEDDDLIVTVRFTRNCADRLP